MTAYRDQYATLFNDGDRVTLLAISTDPIDVLQSWAQDDDFPFTFLSDPDGAVGRQYGASARVGLNNRNLFVVGPDGTIGYRQTPFREVDPTAYTQLAAAVDRLAGDAEEDIGKPTEID